MWTPSDTVSVIATVVLTAGVVASLILGIKSLRKTEKIQEKQLKHTEEISKKEHEGKLLDEIIEYAICCANLGIKYNRGVVVRVKTRQPSYLLDEEFAVPYLKKQMAEAEEYQTVRARAEYIMGIVPENAGNLIRHIKALKESLRQQLNVLHELKVDWRGRQHLLGDASATFSNNISIYEHAVNLSKGAASIKKSHWV